MQTFIFLAAIIAAIWAPYVLQSIAQRARYYARSRGYTAPAQRGAIIRPGFKL